MKALERYEGIEGIAHVIDPKAISKENLYGTLDPNTREWKDGLFTSILRKTISNVRSEDDSDDKPFKSAEKHVDSINKKSDSVIKKPAARTWIIFDGDVDPDWVEYQNALLDDNKLLTLPNGERLNLPPNVRIMFEVANLEYATLATVSRCGMIWFSEDVLSTEMICQHFFLKLRNIPLEDTDEDYLSHRNSASSTTIKTQIDCSNILAPHFVSDGLVLESLKYAMRQEHIMDFTRMRALISLFSMLNQAVRNVINYNKLNADTMQMDQEQLEKYINKSLIFSILWSFSGDSKLKVRCDLGDFIRNSTTIPLPPSSAAPIIDYEVTMQGEWSPWIMKVPKVEVETHKVASPDIVVPTVDTVRHEALLNTWLQDHRPILLSGPPGKNDYSN